MKQTARLLVAATAVLLTAGAACAQQLTSAPLVQANFTGITQVGSGIGNPTQMAFGPDGKLYVATFTSGIKRYDYSPTGGLTNGVTVWSRPNDNAAGQLNGSLGIAFHQDAKLGTVMYFSPAVSSNFNPTLNRIQSIVRLTDSNGNGSWGETGAGEVNQAIVNNLRVTDLHQTNQLLIAGDTLYVGIGSRTRTGGQVSEYGGSPNVDDGEFAYTGSINWIRDLKTLSGNTTTPNVAGFTINQPHTNTQPFTSTDPGKLTVYSTGFRNVFGLGMDEDGQLWATMNQNENPLKPDEIHRSNYHDDHGFPKINEVSGDWKQNQAAINAGFFQAFKEPVATLGDNASANGLDFTDRNGAYDGYAFTVRFSLGSDLLAVNPRTGAVQTIATSFAAPIDVLRDPAGNLLVATHGGGGQVFRVGLTAGNGVALGDLNLDGVINAADWGLQRSNFGADLSMRTPLQALSSGDLNGDLKNDELDFSLFKAVYEEHHGAGSFAAMLQVPEPSGIALMAAAAGSVALCRSGSSTRRAYHSSFRI
ncbi:PQQ-dependent sugar dehydrogenase [Lacipirellula sp.]|uniref:PQQ-dependent sugar dehydrogenase n=1 Tax=Lacipirellula sp. TaxID=2691419 RepID=UPI003D104DFE